jgi:hypothetical protein
MLPALRPVPCALSKFYLFLLGSGCVKNLRVINPAPRQPVAHGVKTPGQHDQAGDNKTVTANHMQGGTSSAVQQPQLQKSTPKID